MKELSFYIKISSTQTCTFLNFAYCCHWHSYALDSNHYIFVIFLKVLGMTSYIEILEMDILKNNSQIS